MTTEFECTSFDELVLIIKDVEFKYSECKVMSERESKRFPNVELVLKSPCGHFAEVLVSSHDSEVGKSNIVRGEYDGLLIDEDVALSLAKLANSY